MTKKQETKKRRTYKPIPVGEKFKELTVIGPPLLGTSGHYHYECSCSCGGTSFPRGVQLTNGRSTTCGNCKRNIDLGIYNQVTNPKEISVIVVNPIFNTIIAGPATVIPEGNGYILLQAPSKRDEA